MSTTCWVRCRWLSGLVALSLCIVATRTIADQSPALSKERADDARGFKEFSSRVQTYVKLQKTVASSLPPLKATELPEMITAHQQALARKIREARPHAKAGDLFTSASREAFRHASRAALEGSGPGKSHAAYMQPGAANPRMRLRVNDVYPDSEPITALPPALLAAFPPLPAEVVYRVVGRTLIVMDVESRVIVDVARLVLPPPS